MNMKHRLRKNKFKIFFLFLITFLILEPLETPLIDVTLGFVLVLAFSFSPYFISPGKGTLAIALSTIFLGICISILPPDSTPDIVRNTLQVIGLLLYFVIISYIFWYTLSSEVISTDLIFLSLTGYFLIGFGFYLAYAVLQDLGLVMFKPKPLLTKDELIYFSYTALATLGFGDFVPVTDIGRRLANVESCLGVLYVAVFIGRLIGLHAETRKKGSSKD